MKRLGLMVTVSLATASCAILQHPPRNLGELGNAAGNLAAIQSEASQKSAYCKDIETRNVPWEEERAMGGAVAVGLGRQNQGFWVDADVAGLKGMPEEKAAAVLTKMVEQQRGKQIKPLSDSEKNNLIAYLAVVGRNLALASSRPNINWTFGVLEDSRPNAFSAPGGYVLVSTGLLKLMDNEAQLAGVLAHEIGHVVHRDAIDTYKKVKANQCSIAVQGGVWLKRGALDGAPPELRQAANFAGAFGDLNNFDLDKQAGSLISWMMDGLIDEITSKGNSQEAEFAADKTALELMLFAGYDSKEYDKLMGKLPSGGGVFDHHPSVKDRVAKLEALRSSEYAAFASASAKPDISGELKVVRK